METGSVALPAEPSETSTQFAIAAYVASPVGIKESQVIARRFFRLDQDVEDAIGEATLRATRAAGQFDTARRLPPWYLHILFMVCLETLRRRKARPACCSLDNAVEGAGSDGMVYADAIPDTATPPVDVQVARRMDAAAQSVLLRHAGRGEVISDGMQELLRRLPRVHRDVIVLLMIEEMPRGDVAALLGLSEARVAAYRSDALTLLRQFSGHGQSDYAAPKSSEISDDLE